MRRFALAATLLLALAACGYTTDDVRQQPPRWSALYPRPWQDVTNCIASAQWPSYQVTPIMFAAEQRATVTAATVLQGYSSSVWIYDIRATGAGAEVTWRARPAYIDIAGMETNAHQIADRCGGRI
jgi:hypothetical protein